MFGQPRRRQRPTYSGAVKPAYKYGWGAGKHNELEPPEAAIYNSAGQVVFRTTGFSVIFDENHTCQDFDGAAVSIRQRQAGI